MYTKKLWWIDHLDNTNKIQMVYTMENLLSGAVNYNGEVKPMLSYAIITCSMVSHSPCSMTINRSV